MSSEFAVSAPPTRRPGTTPDPDRATRAPRLAVPWSWRAERPFVVALAVGTLVRVLLQVALPPAFVYSDGPTYLGFVDAFEPSPDRPVGYGALLWLLALVSRGVDAVAITQHLLGLLTAVALYALMRRWGVRPWPATLATLPILLDEMQLVLEHSVLSDVLFDLLLVLAIVALAWHRPPRLRWTAAAGLLLGAATLVRVTGEPTVLAAAVFCAVVATNLRARVVHVLVLLAAFAAPLVGYASWYHQHHDAWAITQTGGRALYMRTTGFVDCATLSVPSYERTLCPDDPLGQRRDPTYYGWHDQGTTHALQPPAGVSDDAAMRDFAVRAIRSQPVDYARIVGRDFAMTFDIARVDHFGYDTAYKWSFHHYVDYEPTAGWTRPAYAAHGGQMPASRHPVADWFDAYGRGVYLPGPVLLALLAVALVGFFRRGERGVPTSRPLIFLTLSLGLGLVLLPDLTAEFTWRYQLPAVLLVPVAAALGWERLRERRQPGTTATPSTD